MKYILNIGLNNTNYSKVMEQINNSKGYLFDDYNVREVTGTYNNNIEPTLVVSFYSFSSLDSIKFKIKDWCKTLKQDCIALTIKGMLEKNVGILIYNESYKGEKQAFNNKYFIQ